MEHTPKTLKMMNSGMFKLEHVLSMGRFMKIIKDSSIKGNVQELQHTISKNFYKPQLYHKRFVHIYHHCNYSRHIRPHCYKYLYDLRKRLLQNSRLGYKYASVCGPCDMSKQ